ncbi:hypothetical protein VCHENC02_3035B, partial [Vibrio harveyi]
PSDHLAVSSSLK